MSNPNSQGRKLPIRALCARYSVSSKTIDRWLETNILPLPLRINRYRYWDLDELEAFERECKSATVSPKLGRGPPLRSAGSRPPSPRKRAKQRRSCLRR